MHFHPQNLGDNCSKNNTNKNVLSTKRRFSAWFGGLFVWTVIGIERGREREKVTEEDSGFIDRQKFKDNRECHAIRDERERS